MFENVLEHLLRTTPDLVLLCNKWGSLLRVSNSAFHVLGFLREEMEGHLASEFLYPPDLDVTRGEMRAARRGKVTRFFPCSYVHKFGRVVPLVWTGAWIEEDQLYFFVGRDMTETSLLLEKLETDLHSLEEKIRAVPELKRWDGHYEYAIDVFLIAASLWACWVLATGESNFTASPASYRFVANMGGAESIWASVAGVAAGFKILSLAASICLGKSVWSPYSYVPRFIGLAVSGCFWALMGVSSLYGNSDSLFGMVGVLMGVFSWWAILRMVW